MFDESIMLFSCAFRQWVEPVGVVGDSQLHGPALHAFCHSVSDVAIQIGSIFDDVHQRIVHITGKILEHLLLIKYILGKILRGTFFGHFHLKRFLMKSRLDNFKS